jgi:hypothetical protein
MENQEEYYSPSRSELIKIARESCNRNMNTANWNNKERNYNAYKIKNNSTGKYDTKFSTAADRQPILTGVSLKLFILRIVCAAVILTTILLIDKFDWNLYNVNSDFIYKCVTTNVSIDEAENFVVSIYEDLIKTGE